MIRAFLVMLLAGAAFAQSDATSRSWNQPVEPFKIAGNVYYVGASDIASYLIATPKGHIVIDGGFVETAPMILANIAKLEFEAKDVKILLSSHAHLDHAGGLAELKRVTGATLYASRGDIPLLARGGLDDPQFGNKYPFPPVYADRILEDRQRVSLGGTTLTAHITPGHTPGCTTWTMRTGGKDIVFVGSPTAPGYRLTNNPRYPDAVEDYRKTFARLKSLGCDVFLGSHGVFFGLADMVAGKKKYAGCDAYHAFLSGVERRFEEQVARGE